MLTQGTDYLLLTKLKVCGLGVHIKGFLYLFYFVKTSHISCGIALYSARFFLSSFLFLSQVPLAILIVLCRIEIAV